jgi:hypothetical protein
VGMRRGWGFLVWGVVEGSVGMGRRLVNSKKPRIYIRGSDGADEPSNVPPGCGGGSW